MTPPTAEQRRRAELLKDLGRSNRALRRAGLPVVCATERAAKELDNDALASVVRYTDAKVRLRLGGQARA